MAATHGSCLCGDVHFALTFPSKWVAHCHCSLCRRAHGAAFVTWVGMEDTHVSIDDPHSRLRWYASTPGAERGFCSRCGSTLFFRSGHYEGHDYEIWRCVDGTWKVVFTGAYVGV